MTPLDLKARLVAKVEANHRRISKILENTCDNDEDFDIFDANHNALLVAIEQHGARVFGKNSTKVFCAGCSKTEFVPFPCPELKAIGRAMGEEG